MSDEASTMRETGARRDAVSTEPPATAHGGFRDRAKAFRQACRQLFGIPDYERYRAHMEDKHAGEPMLSERDFHAKVIDRKYGRGGGARCC
jgi:uncharacterized short protein YbdD (DUF466 family)